MEKQDPAEDTFEVKRYVVPELPSVPHALTAVPVPSAAIAIEKASLAVCAGELESVTCAVIADVPDCVGVPAMSPVDAGSESPAGNDPLAFDHWYGVFPPLAVSVDE